MARANTHHAWLVVLLLTLAATAARAQCTTNPPPVANARWACAGTASGSSCTAACNQGYNASAAIATCTGSTWTVTPGCIKQCMGTLPTLPGVTWDPACDTAAYNAFCTGTCSTGYGSPVAQCSGGWRSTVIGRCSASPVNCDGLPAAVGDGSWSTSVRGTSPGGIATAECKAGFLGAGSPKSVCQASGQWSTPSPRNCMKGLTNGTAFLARQKSGDFIICSVANGRFSSCRRDNGTAGGAPPLERPIATATLGNRVWILEYVQPARVHICDWSATTRSLSNCVVSSLGSYAPVVSDIGSIVVDPRSSLVYLADTWNDAIIVCNPTLDECNSVVFPVPGIQPWGLTLSPDGSSIYVSMSVYVVRFPLTATGLDIGDITVDADIVMDTTTISSPELLFPYAVAVDATRIVAANVLGNVTIVCPLANPSDSTCTVSSGGGTFAGPGDNAIALSGGFLWVPNAWANAVSVCQPDATGCNLRIAPDDGGANILLNGANSIYIAGP